MVIPRIRDASLTPIKFSSIDFFLSSKNSLSKRLAAEPLTRVARTHRVSINREWAPVPEKYPRRSPSGIYKDCMSSDAPFSDTELRGEFFLRMQESA